MGVSFTARLSIVGQGALFVSYTCNVCLFQEDIIKLDLCNYFLHAMCWHIVDTPEKLMVRIDLLLCQRLFHSGHALKTVLV